MAMPVDVVIGRHMESEWNAAFEAAECGNKTWFDQVKGRADALQRGTRRGEHAVRITGDWIKKHILKGEKFDACFTSGFNRACETAGLLGFPEASWEISPALYEQDWGELLTKYPEQVAEYAESFALRDQDPLHWRPQGGATLAEGLERIYWFLDERLRSYAGKRVYVSCHKGVVWKFRFILEWMTPEEFRALYFSKREEDAIHNMTVLHYTRLDPDGDPNDPKSLADHLSWMRIVTPWISTEPPQWRRIGRKTWTNEELLASVQKIPRILDI